MTSPLHQDVIQATTEAIDHLNAAFRARSQTRAYDGMSVEEMKVAIAYNEPFHNTVRQELELAYEAAQNAVALYKQYKQTLGLPIYADHRETWDALSDMASAILWVQTKTDPKVVISAKYRAEKNYGKFVVEYKKWAV